MNVLKDVNPLSTTLSMHECAFTHLILMAVTIWVRAAYTILCSKDSEIDMQGQCLKHGRRTDMAGQRPEHGILWHNTSLLKALLCRREEDA